MNVKRVRYSFARKAVYHVEAFVDAAPDVRDVSLPQPVRGLELEEPMSCSYDVIFPLLWLNVA